MAEEFDVIIIGAGQAGGPLATAFGKAGKKTALIEKEHVGGTCINEGCTPTKTMVASARVAYLARRAGDYGVKVGDIAVDMSVVRRRKREIVDSFRDGSQGRLEKSDNVDLMFGTASFSGEKLVTVTLQAGGSRELKAETIVINAGGRPAAPPIPGLKEIPYLTSTSIMELDAVPDHLIIIGGGYISLEFGQMFRRFGSKVTVIEQSPRFLPREDEDISESLQKILEADGIEIQLGAKTDSVRLGGKGYSVEITVGEKQQTIQGSHLLVAVGRTSNAALLNLEATGVKINERGWIPVNDQLETNVSGIYAVGDINGGPAFTHISYDDFRILRANLIEGGKSSTKGRLVPYTMYTDPQLGRVGISEQEAKEKKLDVRVFSMPMSSVARALETDEPGGLMKAIVDKKTEMILGAAVLGIEGGEVMTMFQLAMMGNLPYTTLRDAVFAHPTIAEALNNLFSA
jgi:pyruvate/2-oxoglutarate dehydrogenase complex dihydrolipoamide dehydrogenase (E3) component